MDMDDFTALTRRLVSIAIVFPIVYMVLGIPFMAAGLKLSNTVTEEDLANTLAYVQATYTPSYVGTSHYWESRHYHYVSDCPIKQTKIASCEGQENFTHAEYIKHAYNIDIDNIPLF